MHMKNLKHTPAAWGFVISLLGSLPIGYLNLLACQLYRTTGILPLFQFVLGIVLIEVLVVIVSFRLVGIIERRWPIKKHLRLAAVIYLLLLAVLVIGNEDRESSGFSQVVQAHPLFMGVLLSALNPLQLIFWLGWNAYLRNRSSLQLMHKAPLGYYLSTALGTIAGMFAFVLLLDALLNQIEVKPLYFNYGIGALVLLFALRQGYKCYQLNSALQKKDKAVTWQSS